jgi:hypothetical protein
VAEGGALLRRYRGLTSIEGSNPSFSAQPGQMCLVDSTKRAPTEAPFFCSGHLTFARGCSLYWGLRGVYGELRGRSGAGPGHVSTIARMRLRTILWGLSLAAPFLLLGSTAVQAAPATERVSIQLFAGDSVSPGYHVVSFARGRCPVPGDAHRSDALRCFAGNLVIDPCFRAPNGDDIGFVLCLAGNPFGRRLLRITLAQPLPAMDKHPQSGAEFPFAVQLASERTCFIVNGALGVVAGKVPLYACGGGGALGSRIHESGTHWWAWFTASYSHPHWVKVGIRLAAF